jgi:hypothetical protein
MQLKLRANLRKAEDHLPFDFPRNSAQSSFSTVEALDFNYKSFNKRMSLQNQKNDYTLKQMKELITDIFVQK